MRALSIQVLIKIRNRFDLYNDSWILFQTYVHLEIDSLPLICLNFRWLDVSFFFIFIPWSAFGAFVRVLGTCYGKETSRFCQAQNFEASFLCTAHFITSACSFNIGLALLLGIRSLDPRPRARTAPALAWCRRQLGSQTSCSAKSHSQFWSLTFNDKHWNVWWNLAS